MMGILIVVQNIAQLTQIHEKLIEEKGNFEQCQPYLNNLLEYFTDVIIIA